MAQNVPGGYPHSSRSPHEEPYLGPEKAGQRKIAFVALFSPRHLATALLVAVITLVALSDFLPGIPLFQQDWVWPLTRAQAAAGFADTFRVWHDGGLGYASEAPNAFLGALIIYGLGSVIGPNLALLAFTILLTVASAWGAFTLVRSYGTEAFGATLGAAAYVASPVLFNKFGAGHTFYLLAYGMLPVACSCVRLASRSPWFIILGALAGAIVLGQFQFIVLLPIALILTAGPPWTIARLRVLAIILLLSVASHLPDYIIMFQAAGKVATYPLLANPDWQEALSQPLPEAFAGFNYIGGYAAHQLGGALPIVTDIALAALLAATLVALLSGIGAALSSGSGGRVGLALAGIALILIGAFVMSGLDGPLQAVIKYSFSRTTFATAFREFYHFGALLALGAAFVCAAAADSQGNLLRAAGTLAVVILIGTDLSPYTFTSPRQAVARSTRSELVQSLHWGQGAYGRVLWFPGSPSLELSGAWTGGIDSFAPPDGPTASSTYSTDPARLSFWYSQAPSSLAAVARRLGIHEAIVRRGIRIHYLGFLDPQTAKLVSTGRDSAGIATTYAQHLPYDSVGQETDLHEALHSNLVRVGVPTWNNVAALPSRVHLLSPPPGSPAIVARPYGFRTNPLEGWVQTQRWLPAMPELSCLPQSSAMKWSNVKPRRAPCNWRYERRGTSWCLALHSVGLTAYATCSDRGLDGVLEGQAAAINSGRKTLYWTREAYDSRWRLVCADGRSLGPTILVDAYANGWVVDGCESARAWFPPDKVYRIALSVIFVAWASALTEMVRRQTRSTHRTI